MMTPDWLRAHATFFETPVISSQRIAFIPAEVRYHRLMSVSQSAVLLCALNDVPLISAANQ